MSLLSSVSRQAAFAVFWAGDASHEGTVIIEQFHSHQHPDAGAMAASPWSSGRFLWGLSPQEERKRGFTLSLSRPTDS